MTTNVGTIELNIRLDVLGRSSTEAELNRRCSIALDLLRQGVLPPRQIDDRRLVTGAAHLLIVQMPAQGVQEAELFRLSERLSQDCISVYYPAQGRGLLLGPRAADWGEFSIKKFERFESRLKTLVRPEAHTDRMTADLTAQALEWIAHREWLIESRGKLQETTGMLLSDKPQHLVVDDLPEPLRSEVLKQLSRKPMTTDLTAQALEWIAHRESLAESRRRLIELYRMPLQDKPQQEVAEDLPEPLRSEVLKHLSH